MKSNQSKPKKQSGQAYEKLKEDLRAGTVGTGYLFFGAESYLREHYLGELRRVLVPEAFAEFNYHRMEGKDLTVQDIADAVEAMLAAIYLDGGMEAAKGFILDYIKEKAETVSHTRHPLDYKTALQEIVQKNREETLTYRLKGESGPDHDKRFLIELLINSNVIAQGEGRSKKEAEQEAARQALELMGQ